MTSFTLQAVRITLITLLLCAGAVYPVVAGQAAPAATTDPAVAANLTMYAPTLAQFSTLHDSFQAEVAAGKASPAAGEQAQELWRLTQQQLKVHATEITRQENIIMQSAGLTRLESARELTRIAAERERVIYSGYLALLKIAGNTEQVFADSTSVPVEPAKKSGITIKFVPEDTLLNVLE